MLSGLRASLGHGQGRSNLVKAALTWFDDRPGSFGGGEARRISNFAYIILFGIRISNKFVFKMMLSRDLARVNLL
jgi:hypothetical protein